MRGIAFSGGGEKGAFHAGAINYLMGERAFHYVGYGGVSIGAIVAGFLAQYRIGEEYAAASDLSAIFEELRTSMVYKKWRFWGRLAALWKKSVYDSRPRNALVRTHIDPNRIRESGKRLAVGAVELPSGEFKMFDESHPEILDAILASSAFPAMFAPVWVDGRQFIDGGVRTMTPIGALIKMGCDVIDVSICHPRGAPVTIEKDFESLDVASVAIELMGDEIIWRDIQIAKMYNRLVRAGRAVGKRDVTINIIHPPNALGGESMKFDPRVAAAMMHVGFDCARYVLEGR